MTSSDPSYLPQAPSTNIITLRIRAYEFEGRDKLSVHLNMYMFMHVYRCVPVCTWLCISRW